MFFRYVKAKSEDGQFWRLQKVPKVYRLSLQRLFNYYKNYFIFTARRYAKRGICHPRVSVCLSVCLCVCLSHSGIVSKWLNVGSRK